MVTERHERGQLILITAIAVAFILLAIVIVFNGLLFTQTIASEDASKATADVKTSERELEEGIQGIVLRANLEGSDWEDPAKSYVAEYRNATGATKPAIVNVTEDDVTEYGRWESNDIRENDSAEILNVTDKRSIGHLLVNIAHEDGIEFVTDHDGSEFDIEIEPGDCKAERFDLMTGSAIHENGTVAVNGDCDFADTLEPTTALDLITIGEQVDGEVSYKIVANETDNLEADGDPDNEEVPWGVELTYTYDSSDVTATRTITIENVYEDAAHVWPGGESP